MPDHTIQRDLAQRVERLEQQIAQLAKDLDMIIRILSERR